MIFIKFKRERDQTCISFILTNQLPCCLEHPVEERETQISLQKNTSKKNSKNPPKQLETIFIYENNLHIYNYVFADKRKN